MRTPFRLPAQPQLHGSRVRAGLAVCTAAVRAVLP